MIKPFDDDFTRSAILHSKKNKLSIAIMAGLLFSSNTAFAQNSTQNTKESDIEVVTVTAQKRVQNILKVPVTVGTISSDTIEESSSVLLSDVDKFIPGFDFSDSSMTQAGISMRGISSPNISVGGDPSSATFWDDVYMPRAAQNVLFSDLARVEVLKGPQGTLFGRNAAMGVVNIVPNSP
jgi:outer membrane receptor protein involved in Fe transport